MFLSTDANLEIIEKKADLWDAKNWRSIWPKKIFFYFSMLKRFENVFQDEIFWDFIFDIKAASPQAVITLEQKVTRDIFIYNVEKFKLLA